METLIIYTWQNKFDYTCGEISKLHKIFNQHFAEKYTFNSIFTDEFLLWLNETNKKFILNYQL